MTYTTLRQGSTGEDVIKLQESLGFTGEDVDGIYGPKTAQAVRDYQTANSLQVDGIAGNETLGHLYSTAQNQVQTEAQSPSMPDGQTAPFTQGGLEVPSAESEEVAQAKALLDEQLGKKPAAYESEWKQQAEGILGEYMNRDKFSYDVNGDALYQQLQDQYIQSGRLAMMDTMGQAAALTGGYGSSYGQMVGQQAYQSHLQQLTDKIPELYQLARENYDAEGQALLEKFALISEMDDKTYSRYMDELNSWMNEREYLTGRLDTAKSFEYQAKQDAIAQDQWERQFAEQQRQYEESMGLTKEQWEWEKAHSGGSGGSGGGVGETVTSIPDDVIERCEELFGDDESIDRHLSAKLRQGTLTEEDAFYLLENYCSDEYLKANYPGLIDTGVQGTASGSKGGGGPKKITTTTSMLR